MKLVKEMKMFDSNGRSGVITRVCGEDIDVIIEHIITISFNNHKNKEKQKRLEQRSFKITDIGIKLFFSLEDIALSYDEIIQKPEYKVYAHSILKEKELRQKIADEEIKGRVGNLPLFTIGMLESKKQVYLNKEKSLEEETAYWETVRDSCHLKYQGDEPYFARMDLKLEHEGFSFYERIYIGKSAISLGDDFYVYDWRSPVCSRYYLKNETSFVHKDDFYEWTFQYDLLLRRAIMFKEFQLRGFENEYVIGDEKNEGITDPFLMEVLTEKSVSGKLTDIIKSIQANQNNIIRSNIKENFIVQGCAGSGKTMILLHRLSYLLFNNKDVNLNSVRIISPNSVFDNHINELAKELELDKIKKGTIEEYYEEKLRTYQLIGKSERVDFNFNSNNEEFDYFYSEEFEKVLDGAFEKWYSNIKLSTNNVLALGKKVDLEIDETKSIKNTILNYKEMISKILNKNQQLKKELLFDYIELLPNLPEMDSENQKRLFQIIDEKDIEPKELKSLFESNNLSDKSIIEKLQQINSILIRISKFCYEASFSLELAPKFIEDLYASKNEKKRKIKLYKAKLYQAIGMTLAYSDLSSTTLDFLKDTSWPQLEEKVFGKKVELRLNMISAQLPNDMDIINKIYFRLRKEIFKDLNIGVRENNLYYRFDMFALLYLANLYSGPLSSKDTLLNIDEGQDISAAEYRLLNHINGSEVVFNIYGDNNQLIKEKRGIKNWNKLDLRQFKYYELNENYRNTIQITEFCNQQFGYKILPIGLNGRKVNIISEWLDINNLISDFLLEDGQRKAIIIKDEETVSRILKNTKEHFKFNFVVSNNSHLYKNKINVLTVQMAKGLEFDNVLVIDTNMSENEQYIAFTRALSFVTYYKVS